MIQLDPIRRYVCMLTTDHTGVTVEQHRTQDLIVIQIACGGNVYLEPVDPEIFSCADWQQRLEDKLRASLPASLFRTAPATMLQIEQLVLSCLPLDFAVQARQCSDGGVQLELQRRGRPISEAVYVLLSAELFIDKQWVARISYEVRQAYKTHFSLKKREGAHSVTVGSRGLMEHPKLVYPDYYTLKAPDASDRLRIDVMRKKIDGLEQDEIFRRYESAMRECAADPAPYVRQPLTAAQKEWARMEWSCRLKEKTKAAEKKERERVICDRGDDE